MQRQHKGVKVGYNNIDEIMTRMQREREIHCPYCDALWHDEDYQMVSMWGYSDTPDSEAYCEECERDFIVRELVSRTYETFGV